MTYAEYWNAVLGIGNARDVVAEYSDELSGATLREVDNWVTEAEAIARGQGLGEVPQDYHDRAVVELLNPEHVE